MQTSPELPEFCRFASGGPYSFGESLVSSSTSALAPSLCTGSAIPTLNSSMSMIGTWFSNFDFYFKLLDCEPFCCEGEGERFGMSVLFALEISSFSAEFCDCFDLGRPGESKFA
jgi:hypothetical protein